MVAIQIRRKHVSFKTVYSRVHRNILASLRRLRQRGAGRRFSRLVRKDSAWPADLLPTVTASFPRRLCPRRVPDRRSGPGVHVLDDHPGRDGPPCPARLRADYHFRFGLQILRKERAESRRTNSFGSRIRSRYGKVRLEPIYLASVLKTNSQSRRRTGILTCM